MGERRGVAIVFAIAIAGSVAATAATTPACTTHKCDLVDQVNVPGTPGHDKKIYSDAGFKRDPRIWESGPIDGPWIPYQHQQTIFVDFKGEAPGPVEQISVYISEAEVPYTDPPSGDIFATVSGNGAELQWVGKAGINVRNNTCQDYFARIVVTFAPTPDASAPLDAAADAVQDAPSTQ